MAAMDVTSHVEFLRRLARGLVRDAHAAEDVAQDALVAALTSPAAPRGPVRPWLAGVARNLSRMVARDRSRRARREQIAARSEALPPAAQVAADLEISRKVVAAVEALDEIYKTVIVLRFLHDLPTGEIAKRLGVPVETVRTRLKRAFAKLRARLDRDHGGSRATWIASVAPLLGTSGRPPGLALTAAGGVAVKKVVAVLSLLILILLLGALPFALRGGGPAAPPAGPGSTPAPAAADATVASAEGGGAGASRAPSTSTEALHGPPPDDVAEVAILSRDGTPASGAEVLLLRRPLDVRAERPDEVARATTDDSGRVRFPAVPFARYMLKIDHPDHAVTGDVECFGGNVTEVRLRAGGVLHGVVKEAESGRPIPGATVYAMDWCMVGVLHEWWTETDEAGRYRIERVGPGRMNLRAFAPGRVLIYPTTFFEVLAGQETRVDFDLPVGIRVAFRVVDDRTGLPVPEARVAYSRERPTTGPGERIVAEPIAREGRVWIEVSAPGYVGRFLMLEPAKIERPQDPIEVRLTPCVPVRGRVVSPEGRPMPGLAVALASVNSARDQRAFTSLATDEDGGFSAVCGISGGTLSWWIRLPDGSVRRGAGSDPIAADAEEVRLPPIVAEVGWAVGGVVLAGDEGPLPRALVTAYGRDGRTELAECFVDPRGRFRLAGLTQREVVLALGVMEGWAPVRRAHLISGDEKLVWRLDPGYEIAGRLLDLEGRPIPRAWVGSTPSGATSRTDEQGRFRLRGLGSGPHRVRLQARPDTGVDGVPGDTFDLVLRVEGDVR
ncbi:MAG: sigma-70 family RNA polymerase sigma factor [Planctomycetota bacterium]